MIDQLNFSGGYSVLNRNLATDKVGLVCQNFCVGRTTPQRLLVLVVFHLGYNNLGWFNTNNEQYKRIQFLL